VLAGLPGVRRMDDGSDLLAFRAAGATPSRAVYVYLYGADANVIWFDLEDEAAGSREWDHAVERGQARTLAELRHKVLGWLGMAAPPC
jgi:hypothetical protein